jgi:hypothetical protein
MDNAQNCDNYINKPWSQTYSLIVKYVFINMSITSLINLKAPTTHSFHKKQDNLSSLDSLKIQ